MRRPIFTVRRLPVFLVVGLGLVLLVAMYYQLWWTRDLVLYGGKNVSDQRAVLFERTGLNSGVLADVEAARAAWPEILEYKTTGESPNRSYVEYLLAPRVPLNHSKSGYEVLFRKNSATFTPTPDRSAQTQDLRSWFPPFALLLSVLAVSGVAFLLSRRFQTASAPECVGVSLGLLLLSELVSKACSDSALFGMMVFSALGLLGMGAALLRCGAVRKSGHGVQVPRSGDRGVLLLVALSLTVLFIAIVLSLILSVVVVPDDWDAWAIWGPKAKVLALGHGPLADVTRFGQRDYPLLWPSVWAFSAWCGGGWEEQWSRGWGAVFFALTAWQVGGIVSRETGRRLAGLLAAVLFVSFPKILVVSSWSYAEAPLWFLTALWFGRLMRARDGAVQHALWAGCFGALAAMTKNEGVLMAVLGFVWLFACTGPQRWKRGLAYLLPVIVVCGPWFFWIREVLHLGDHATDGLALSAHRLHYVANRLSPAFRSWLDIWKDYQQWGGQLAMCVLSAGWLFCRRPGWLRSGLMIPVALWLGYFVLILFTPVDVLWQMGTSWDRLTIQGLVPLCVLVMTGLWPYCGFSSDDQQGIRTSDLYAGDKPTQ